MLTKRLIWALTILPHGIEMNAIVRCDFRISLDFLRNSFFAIHAIAIHTGEVIKVYEVSSLNDFSAADAVHAIEGFRLNVQDVEVSENLFFLFVKQLEQYKNNVYGINLNSANFSKNSDFLIFFEWYVRKFSFEFICFFRELHLNSAITWLRVFPRASLSLMKIIPNRLS